MSIGKRFPNHSSWNDLPSSIAALYELSHLSPEDVECGIESGAINPDMKMVSTCPRVKIFPVDRGGRRNISTRQDAPATP